MELNKTLPPSWKPFPGPKTMIPPHPPGGMSLVHCFVCMIHLIAVTLLSLSAIYSVDEHLYIQKLLMATRHHNSPSLFFFLHLCRLHFLPPDARPLIVLQNLKEGFTPNIKRMQNLAKPGPLHVSESGVGLLTHNSSEYEMGNLRRDESFNI